MKKTFRKITAAMTAIILAVSMAACGSAAAENSGSTAGNSAAEAVESTAAAENGIYAPGTYTGIGKGKNGDVKVEVEFDANSIKNVKVVEHSETEGIAEAPVEKIPAKITEQQSLAVDAVSGATVTSDAIIEAVADCVKQAGGDVDALMEKKEAAASSEVEETEADVVVIGAGSAGSAAALAAVQNGKEVILLEKTASPMGAGTLAGGMFAADSQLQKDAGETVDKEWLYNQYMAASQGFMNSILVRKIIDESGRTVDWLMENGMELNLVDAGSGTSYNHIGMPATLHGYNEGGTVAITKLVGEFEKAGGEVFWSTPAYELIVTDGKVTGVLAKKEDGSTLKINSKAVVIATGGFGGNAEMMEEHFGSSYTMGEVLQNTGDGLNMAWAVGADKYGTGVTQYFWETFKGEEIGALAEKLGEDWWALTNWSMFPNLRVNKFGQRFSNEANASLFALHGAELAMQPGQEEYVILDNSCLQAVADEGLCAIEDQYAKWVGDEQFFMEFNEPNSTDMFYEEQHTPADYRPLLDAAVGSGVVFKADTPEALAEAMGMEPEVFAASVNQYNEAIQNGKDEMFFADTTRLVEVKEAPYYAIKFSARNLGTLGGLRINEKMEVLDKDFNKIDGLYAAGADCGGAYGRAYVDFEGGTLGFAYTSGRLAGISASEYAE